VVELGVRPSLTDRLRAAGCVYAEDEAALLQAAASDRDELDRLVARRIAGSPLEHLLGWAEFYGLRVAVAPGVFVPRRRTELLAAEAVRLAGRRSGLVVVEVCCGAAAVATALARMLDRPEVYAGDLDPSAVACAQRNLRDRGTVVRGDLYDPLPSRLEAQVDLICANAPYVPTAAIALMPREARHHEPVLALDGGPDGLDVQRRVVTGAVPWLAPGGHLLVETSAEQAPHTAALMSSTGLATWLTTDEERDATVVVGQRGH
jgi:release factor glutamine methyltransferase